MTNGAEKFRGIFERFQNLNLIALIEDLRRGQVAQGNWIEADDDHGELYNLCPLYHGVRRDLESAIDFACAASVENELVARHLGVRERDVRDFVGWWDGWGDANGLLITLERILAERRIDADAVQAMVRPSEWVVPDPNVQAGGAVFGRLAFASPNFKQSMMLAAACGK